MEGNQKVKLFQAGYTDEKIMIKTLTDIYQSYDQIIFFDFNFFSSERDFSFNNITPPDYGLIFCDFDDKRFKVDKNLTSLFIFDDPKPFYDNNKAVLDIISFPHNHNASILVNMKPEDYGEFAIGGVFGKTGDYLNATFDDEIKKENYQGIDTQIYYKGYAIVDGNGDLFSP